MVIECFIIFFTAATFEFHCLCTVHAGLHTPSLALLVQWTHSTTDLGRKSCYL